MFLFVCLTALLSGCAEEQAAGPVSGEEVGMPEVVVFSDPVLENMVREQMSKPEGDISIADAEAVKELSLSIEWQPEIPPETQIRDLHGLESFKNLESLDLQYHAVTDISPLAGLSKLTSLSLGGNPVTDLMPLSGLTNLTWLTLFNCQAQDYGPLANLTNLNGLLMEYSTISDASVLSGLTKLIRLSLANTQVGDVSPLAGLTSLRELRLAECPITDYSPLAEIYPFLKDKDFAMAASLSELGFVPVNDGTELSFQYGTAEIKVGRPEWNPSQEGAEGYVFLFMPQENGGVLAVRYVPDTQKYDFKIDNLSGEKTGYSYDA